jgi:hypothetical protein
MSDDKTLGMELSQRMGTSYIPPVDNFLFCYNFKDNRGTTPVQLCILRNQPITGND